jgi:pimeloyl-ACP methyl ester carboxylesterase
VLLFAGCQPPKILEPEPVRSEIHTIQTEDNWTLALHRYRSESPDGDRLPLVLCHGFSCNARFWDLTPELSLARHLARRGFDVWAPDLRGSGHSTKPGLVQIRRLIRPTIPELPQRVDLNALDLSKANWTMDDYIERDMPAILDYVTAHTGYKRVVWVGHSMGGTIALGRMGRWGEPRIGAFVGLATSVTMPQPPNNVLKAVGEGGLSLKLSSLIVGHSVASSFAGRAGVYLADTLMYNRDNISDEAIQQIYFNVMEDVPPGVLEQQMEAINTGHYLSADGQFDYAEHLTRIDAPMLLMVGKLDNLCPPESSRYIYRNVTSSAIDFYEAATVNNYRANYGHFDLVLGKPAPDEIYPRLTAWLRRHAKAAPDDRATAAKPAKGRRVKEKAK